MFILGSLGVSASGLTAQRLRMDVVANNIANAGSTRTVRGGPYRRQVVVLAEAPEIGRGIGAGVKVVSVTEDRSPPRLAYDPGHPDARPDGYVEMPNVEILTEMVDMLSASRAYEANVAAINTAKAMAIRALDIGRG